MTAALIAVNLAAVIFGAVALFGRLDASPVWIVAGRAAFAAVALAAVVAARRLPLRPDARVVATGALLAAHWAAFFASVQMAGVAVGTLTVSTFPLFIILIEAAMKRRAPTPAEVAAGAAVVAGVALIAGPIAPGAALGAAVGLVSAMLFAVFALASQSLVRQAGPVVLSLQQNAAAALVLVPFLPFTPGLQAPQDWLAVAALGVFGTALVHQLYLFALARLPAAVCGAFVTMEPVYAILLAALLFAEPAGPMVFAAAALIVGASLLLLRSRGG